jgi:transposase
MARLRGWAPKGQRCHAAVPHGHWKTVTFVGGLTPTGFIAPMLLDGPMDGEVFRTWCEQMLAPALRPGDIVIMDNLAAHKVAGVSQAIEACGAR